MKFCSAWFEPGETIGKKYTELKPEIGVDFDYYAILKEGRNEKDRVIWDIRTRSEPYIFLAGNPLLIESLAGLGVLFLQDPVTGETIPQLLEPGMSTTVPRYKTFWFENLTPEKSLIMRDTSDNFDEANERPAREFFKAPVKFF